MRALRLRWLSPWMHNFLYDYFKHVQDICKPTRSRQPTQRGQRPPRGRGRASSRTLPGKKAWRERRRAAARAPWQACNAAFLPLHGPPRAIDRNADPNPEHIRSANRAGRGATGILRPQAKMSRRLAPPANPPMCLLTHPSHNKLGSSEGRSTRRRSRQLCRIQLEDKGRAPHRCGERSTYLGLACDWHSGANKRSSLCSLVWFAPSFDSDQFGQDQITQSGVNGVTLRRFFKTPVQFSTCQNSSIEFDSVAADVLVRRFYALAL
jgi:hypothetical protein